MYRLQEVLIGYYPEIILILLAIILIMIVLHVIQAVKISRLEKKYRAFMDGVKVGNLEDLLLDMKKQMKIIAANNKEIMEQQKRIEEMSLNYLRGCGLVRYNAFQDTGGDFSFSVALIDGKSNGVILTSIFSRDENRIYAKPLIRGQSTYELSKEEMLALKKAKETTEIGSCRNCG